MMQAAARIRSNATQVTFALVPSLYAELQKACADVVAQAADVPVCRTVCGRRLRRGRRQRWRSGPVSKLSGRS